MKTNIKNPGHLPAKKENILFIDDNKVITEIAQELLADFGFRVEGMIDPLSALNHFKNNPNQFDLVISDLNMPVLDGYQLIDKISRIRPDIPILVCSAYGKNLSLIKDKICGYLTKPVDIQTMVEAIRCALDDE